MKAKQMLVLTDMLSRLISEVDDLKAMIRQAVNDDFKENYEGDEE
jgi:molybdenum-dependent DNA-binding transcriptional regulator ModE